MFWIKTSDILAVVETDDGSFTILFCSGLNLKDVSPPCAAAIIREIKTPRRLG